MNEDDQEIADWLESLSDEELDTLDQITANIFKEAVDTLTEE